MSIFLDPLEILLFFEKNTTARLSQNILRGPEMESKTIRPEMKFLNQMDYFLAS